MYKVTKTAPWVKTIQQHVDEMEKQGWKLVSHSHATGTCVVTYVWEKQK